MQTLECRNEEDWKISLWISLFHLNMSCGDKLHDELTKDWRDEKKQRSGKVGYQDDLEDELGEFDEDDVGKKRGIQRIRKGEKGGDEMSGGEGKRTLG